MDNNQFSFGNNVNSGSDNSGSILDSNSLGSGVFSTGSFGSADQNNTGTQSTPSGILENPFGENPFGDSSIKPDRSFGGSSDRADSFGSAGTASTKIPENPFGENPFGDSSIKPDRSFGGSSDRADSFGSAGTASTKTPENPFGENPFGPGFVAGDQSFRAAKTQQETQQPKMQASTATGNEERTCPKCGMPLMGRDNYCIGCGEVVNPVSGSQKSASTYGSSNGKTSSYDRSTNYSSRSSVRIQESSFINYKLIIRLIPLIIALIGFLYGSGLFASQKVTTLYSFMPKGDFDVSATISLYSKGDVVDTIEENMRVNAEGYKPYEIDYIKNYMAEEMEKKYGGCPFIQFSVAMEGDEIIVKINFNDLKSKANIQKMMELGIVEKQRLTGHVSLSRTVENLKKEGWVTGK
ncbi:MAG: DUF1307 domain-containing protein [Lachnospiraceae bacterium]|nr:DUF1307 domain-containing protein [Lachnospiraceae bacterium]